MLDHIPYEDLEKGLQIVQRNVESLIKTANLLNSNHEFLHSAIFSILAIEEMAKGQILYEHKSSRKDLSIAEWKRITRGKPRRSGHYEKFWSYLKRIPINPESVKQHPEITTDEIIELIARYHVRMKLNVLYVNWDRRLSKWYWLPDDYSQDEQRKRSDQLLSAARKGYERYRAALMKD